MGDVAGADPAGQPAEPDRDDGAAVSGEPDKTADLPQPTRVPASLGRSNELDVGWGERPRDSGQLSEDDERLLRERPPHWD